MPNDLLAAGGRGELPPGLLAALVPLLFVVLALDVFCLVDLARATSVRTAPKWVWVIVIVFVSAPIRALAAAIVRGTLATAGIALAVLFLLPIAGGYHPIGNWLPSALARAPVDLLRGTHLAHYRP